MSSNNCFYNIELAIKTNEALLNDPYLKSLVDLRVKLYSNYQKPVFNSTTGVLFYTISDDVQKKIDELDVIIEHRTNEIKEFFKPKK